MADRCGKERRKKYLPWQGTTKRTPTVKKGVIDYIENMREVIKN